MTHPTYKDFEEYRNADQASDLAWSELKWASHRKSLGIPVPQSEIDGLLLDFQLKSAEAKRLYELYFSTK